MKKTVLTLLICIAGFSTLAAQNYDRAIGFRIGTMVGASYKQFVTTSQAIEGILDLDLVHQDDMSLRVTGIYQFHFPIKSVDGLAWYVGPGATVGTTFGSNGGFLLGIDGMAGIEYKLSSMPLCFAFDFNPKLYLISYENVAFNASNVGLTIRYTF